MSSAVRVRFAPSPSGFLHIGVARTALFNFLYARHHGGTFVLRIEDTDQERSTDDSMEAIYEGLKWLGLNWDEGPGAGGSKGPYKQSERLPLYREAVDRLLREGKAYRCFCTPEELQRRRDEALKRGDQPKYDRQCHRIPAAESEARAAKGERYAIRFLMPDGETKWDDGVRGEVTFQNSALDDLVIMRSGGLPTYNFAVVIDDHTMDISDVLRGDDHISNTPRQIQIYKALGLPHPRFAHFPMILGPDGTRLSKRHGATSVTAFRDEGILPETMVNFLALLGWAYDGEREIFSMEELIRYFTLDRVSRNPAIFNYEKLDWMNGEYFRALPLDTRTDLIVEHLRKTGELPPGALQDRVFLKRAVEAAGDRVKRPRQFLGYSAYLFVDKVDPDPALWAELQTKPGIADRLRKLADALQPVAPFEHDPLEKATRGLAAELGVKAGDVIMPARIALTGKKVTPGIFDVMLLLGPERTVKRLRDAADRLEAPSAATAG